jgi:hypothetical protein
MLLDFGLINMRGHGCQAQNVRLRGAVLITCWSMESGCKKIEKRARKKTLLPFSPRRTGRLIKATLREQ